MPRRRGDALIANEVRILELVTRMAAEAVGTTGTARLYGYPIFERLTTELVGDEPRISDATVYRCLRRLEERGAVTGRWESPDEPAADGRPGRPRRYYELTAAAPGLLVAGRRELDTLDRRPAWYRQIASVAHTTLAAPTRHQ